jgi:hypothetical protein
MDKIIVIIGFVQSLFGILIFITKRPRHLSFFYSFGSVFNYNVHRSTLSVVPINFDGYKDKLTWLLYQNLKEIPCKNLIFVSTINDKVAPAS